MRTPLRRTAIILVTVLVAVALAAAFAYFRRGGTRELPTFFVWSLPLGITIGLLSGRPWPRWRWPLWRALAAALAGLLVGVAWTLVGWFVVGGWMLAWDFPVLYCWALAGAAGMCLGGLTLGTLTPGASALGFAAALVPLAALWLYGTRPEPAVLIVYREHPEFDAAQRVYDSTLTQPHSSGMGRETKWPTTFYSRKLMPTGETAALIGMRRASDRDSIRAALVGNPLVVRVVDTAIAQ